MKVPLSWLLSISVPKPGSKQSAGDLIITCLMHAWQRKGADSVFIGALLGTDVSSSQYKDTVAERLMRARLTEKPALHLLERLQQYYRDRSNLAAELEIAEAAFRTQPSLRRYQELRDLAKHLDRWETLRPELLAFLQQAGNTRNTTLLTEIALDEGNPAAE